ncbi:type VI secretion system Vgr family protein [Inquilinus limosus]|uniref:type VI secretion system Vgr family protein n=1 Tax=Inquilinus limosus TaxID=171674 RepID=UPI00068E842F|nr:type VI secretion system tip protein TssI/VgrG [Inquilinus limosus]
MSPYDYTGSLTQAGRLLSVHTPLGEDVFLLEVMDGTEGLSGLFEFRLRVRSKRQDVTPKELVGLPINWSLELPGGERRQWSGVVAALAAGPALGEGMRSYTLEIRPWLWLFTHTSDCRIFQNKTTQQILETIFTEAKIRDTDFGPVIGPKAVREYCVQYNETDYAFICRLLEEEGWCWWFRHEPGSDGAPPRHVFVVADGAHAWTFGAEPDVRFTTTNLDLNDVTGWTRRFAFKPGQAAEADWNFETPQAPVTRNQPSVAPIESNRLFEMYRWGGRFMDKDRADHVTRRRIEAHEAGFEVIEAESGNRRIAPAQKFRLYGHPIAAENAEYAVVGVVHSAEDQTYVMGERPAPSYSNRFRVIPASTRWVPEQRTPHPRIDGMQTALVVGPPGEEIHTDRYGRVKVKFPWDRYAKGDDTSSCWLRVSQPWGGSGWGSQTIPRIGMEVLVSYLEGDPDKPLVVGVVPNPTTMPSLALPANKTRTGFKSSTSPGGAGFNEMTFEDQAGAEELFQHAQKDATEIVRNNKRQQVGNAHTVAAETLHLTTVKASQAQMTPKGITLQHKGAMIHLDETQIILSFNGKHSIRLSADGVETQSETKVFSAQGAGGAAKSFVNIFDQGVHVLGDKDILQQAAGATVLMNAEAIDAHGPPILLNCSPPDTVQTAAGGQGPTVADVNLAAPPGAQGANQGPGVAQGGGAGATSWSANPKWWGAQSPPGSPADAKFFGAEAKAERTTTPTSDVLKAEATVAGATVKQGNFEIDAFAATGKVYSGVTNDGFGAQASGEAAMARLKMGGDVGNPATGSFGLSGEGKLMAAEASAGYTLGDDGQRIGIAGAAKASAAAVDGKAEGQFSVPIGWLPGVPDDWTLASKGSVSGSLGSVGGGAGGHAYYDRADSRYHAGGFGELEALVGAELGVDLSVGPPPRTGK